MGGRVVTSFAWHLDKGGGKVWKCGGVALRHQVCAIKEREKQRGCEKKRLQTIPNWKLLNSFSLCPLLLNFSLAPNLFPFSALFSTASSLHIFLFYFFFAWRVQIGTWISFRMTFAPSRVNCSQLMARSCDGLKKKRKESEKVLDRGEQKKKRKKSGHFHLSIFN